ncbi:hypothetical protein MUP05_07605 [Candidatus Bathyarchaeota archaeon]|nr:hypothetical protein [Candidatus Bathyarchaeota archaeon]
MSEEAYSAAVKVYALYGAFFMQVAREFGKEKAVALHRNAHELMGIKTGRMIKKQMGSIRYDLKTLAEILRKSNVSIGIDSQMVEGLGSLRSTNCVFVVCSGLVSAGSPGLHDSSQ